MPKPRASMTNWFIIERPGYNSVIFGEVTGHPKFPDGTEIKTSGILNRHTKNGMLIVETRNTVYTLNPMERA